MERIKVQIKGGKHDGEIFLVPKDLHIPGLSDSLTENEINLVGLTMSLNELEQVVQILQENPMVDVEEIEPKKPWEK